MTTDAICRALAYLDARTAIISALGWGFSIQWWLCKPEGDQ